MRYWRKIRIAIRKWFKRARRNGTKRCLTRLELFPSLPDTELAQGAFYNRRGVRQKIKDYGNPAYRPLSRRPIEPR